MQQPLWIHILPFAIIALVVWRRWKGMAVARPLTVERMWIAPLLCAVLVSVILWAAPPSAAGWGVFAGGVIAGGIVGWQRARLIHLHIDEATGAVMLRQSPAGLLVIVAIFFLRRLFVPSQGGAQVVQGAHPALPLLTDALLGFALGMLAGYRVELWRRARQLRERTPAMAVVHSRPE